MATKNVFKLACLIASITVLAVLAFKIVPIENFNYIFFSITFFALLLIGFMKPISEFFLLMNCFMFLGFWGKLTLHILTQGRLGEASGQFNAEILNKAALTSGWFALILFIFQLTLKQRKIRITSLWKESSPQFVFPKYFNLIFLTIVFIVAIINHYLGIFHVGVQSTYSLFLPLSILFYWFMGPGSSFIAFSLTSKEYKFLDTFTIALTMAAISATTISRNALLYFSYPVFVKFILEIKNFKKAVIHTTIIFIFFIISLFAITQMRRLFYYPEDNAPPPVSKTEKLPIQASPKIKWTYVKESIVQVFLDRWIGLEGVIVAQVHPSDENFKTLVSENAKINRTSLYRELSGSTYPTSGSYLFYTMPGPLGLLAFIESNSLKLVSWIVYLSILGLTYMAIEFFLVGMPKSVISWWAASNMTQISLFPIYNIKIYTVYFVIIIAVTIILKKISDNYFQEKS